MGINLSQRAAPAPQLTINAASLTGTPALVGVLAFPQAIIIFDNMADVAVTITIGTVSWKTFAAGSALVLDLRANHGNAPNYSFDQGTPIFASGSAGTGSFTISYLYAKEG